MWRGDSGGFSARSAMIGLLGAICATAACDRGSPPPEQAEANVAATSPDEAAPAVAAPRAGAVDRSHAGERAPDAVFTDAGGARTTLADLKGGPLLVNLWATWCAPCVKEMPTLDAVAREGRVRVVAVSQDMDPEKAKAFLARRRFAALQPYFDPRLDLSLAYEANLPTTILYGADGREKWRVTGELDWTGAKAGGLLAEAS